jgi:hypothetical protein
MISVGNRFVATARAVDVCRFVLATVMSGSTDIGIALADRNRMFSHRTAFLLVAQVSFLEVIDMPFVFDLQMPAIGTVLVSHDASFSIRGQDKYLYTEKL